MELFWFRYFPVNDDIFLLDSEPEFFAEFVLPVALALFGGDDFQESLFKVNLTDCILYSEDGTQFDVHKEILCQTPFLQRILFSTENTCCGKIEIFCPCTTDDLEFIVKFLYSGKISIEAQGK